MDFLGSIAGLAASALTGGIGGGLLRLAAQWLGNLTAKGDRDHEYRMAQLSAEVTLQTQTAKLDAVRLQGQLAADVREVDALIEATRMQGRPTGVRWADAISSLVRPVLTFWWQALFTAVKLAMLVLALDTEDVWTALVEVWTPADQMILGSIIGFWFVDRSLRKHGHSC